MNVDIRIVLGALMKAWGECTAVVPNLVLITRLRFYQARQMSVVAAGAIKSTSANNQHTAFDTGGESGATAAQMATVWVYLIEQYNRAVAELGGAPTDLQIEAKMESYLRPVYGHTNNYMFLMK